MNILIIGGSRFVGPHLVQMLSGKGHQLTVFNRGNFSVTYPQGVKLVQGDRNVEFGLKEKFDAVIDMCAYTGSQTEKAIQELNFDYFLHFGTVAAYEKTSLFPITEEHPIGEWPSFGEYGKGKVECERVLEKTGVKYATFRPAYILGPKNYCDREACIYSRIKQGTPLVIPGDGMALAQFVFVDEVARTIALLVEQQPTGSFNIAGDQIISLVGLVEEMGKIIGIKPVVAFDPNAVGDNFKEEDFPFDNETIFVANNKIKEVGMDFIPLIDGLKRDYEAYYRDAI